MELDTGFGKSVLGAVMIIYYFMKYQKDAVNIVPSDDLKLDQVRLYCPTACRAGNDLYNDMASVAYYYSHFAKILKEGKALLQALAIIDENHAFLKEPA